MRIEAGIIIGVALSVSVVAGCSRRKAECKGFGDCPSSDYECVDGSCVLKVKSEPAATTTAREAQAKATAQPASDPNNIALDGLPAVIPPPGSQPPTVAEWASVTREVAVRGSSALGCETKMLREWLRVSCRKQGNDAPLDVRTTREEGQQSFLFHTRGSLTSVVVQVVKGKDYRARYTWDSRGRQWGANLVVAWPASAARPSLSIDR